MIELVSDIYYVVGKKVVAIFNIGNVIEMVSWRDKVDVILLVWQGGQEVGYVVVDFVLGKVMFFGKLVIIFLIVYEDILSVFNFLGEEVLGVEEKFLGLIFMGIFVIVVYEEDIYVGYCYF